MNLNREQYKLMRERMISMVLATDMSFHFSDMGKLKARLISEGEKQNFILNYIFY